MCYTECENELFYEDERYCIRESNRCPITGTCCNTMPLDWRPDLRKFKTEVKNNETRSH